MEPWSLAFTRCRASELALSWAAFKVYNEEEVEVEVEEEEEEGEILILFPDLLTKQYR